MQALQPLGDTRRTISWEELPPSVREIPDGFDPLADGVLMRHQAEWVKDDSDLKATAKGRRTGITFAEALGDTIIAASRKSAGGDNVYYIGDTKEKGLEFIGYCARMARIIAEAQGAGMSGIEEFLFEDQQEDGSTKHINAYRIRFASGFQIVALSSRPASVRGLQGIVVIDEAAFHANVQAVLDAATALLIWGGKIRIISSHNGKKNPFNQLCKDIQAGRYGEGAKVYRITFDDAVANGLYERVCLMKGWDVSAEGKRKWYERIRNSYGPRVAVMREELDAIPRDGGGQAIPGVWIEEAMREARPILRIALDDDFAKLPEDSRRVWGSEWIDRHLKPLLARLDPAREHVFGQDFARHRDFSVVAPLEIGQTLIRRAPFLLEMHNVPTRQQEQILWALIAALPRFRGGAMDATGSGATLAEYTADKFGHERIHQVMLSQAWYREHMPKLVDAFETGMIDLPRDADIESDLRALEEIDGIIKLPDIRKQDLKDAELKRHGDSAIAFALGWFASQGTAEAFDYRPVPRNPRDSRQSRDHEHISRPVCVTAGFRRGII
ncbi:hypothetical protein [Desulfocurvibacter africanus]|uniref:Mu-like prophage FluMu protein gp28 n=1 Tax=Desulfocurvibacter africanus subsp. africanus str. Walvis Bay TaxID=690850 RepID=F3YW08_DESAF|nr:hypothetical protein [Desulfocurvibacter africanus]EGJ49038.1 hypothetical protein Desaf_0686 [Desulfocurvibacter africanus subsp. africanus str. Walvis Bay]